jgi:O-antigen ligase
MRARQTGKTRDHLGKTITIGFLVVVVFTAVAHGAVEPWSVFVFEALVVILLILWSIKVLADRRLKLNIPQLAWPIAALAVVGLAQSIAIDDGSGRWRSLSMNVGFTRGAVTVLIFLLISFLIAANSFSNRGRLSGLSRFLVIYGLAMALFGIVQYFSWNGRFFWLRPTEVTTPFGPFANHNHFAGYMELLIPIPIALIITRAVTTELRLLFGFAAILMGLAAVLSLSRGGIISIAAAMLFLVVMSLWLPRAGKKRSPRGRLPHLASQALIIIAIVGVISAGILWIGADPVIKRVTQGQQQSGDSPPETFYSSRGWVWRDTFTMIRSHPLLGVGMGAYETAFAIYTKSDGSLRVPQAHNDYLQVVADCGVVGGVIALWFIALVFRAVARGTRSRDPLYSGLALGSGAGIFAMLVHSLFDFNLQLPANALLFLLLSAVAVHVGTAVGTLEVVAPRGVSRNSTEIETEIVSSPSFARGAS